MFTHRLIRLSEQSQEASEDGVQQALDQAPGGPQEEETKKGTERER